ncbi:DUF3422 family protein [Qipengyuania sp.]|uniref:DUF3422 family protein n=1 Tax=Qipengyuania sp. TaxID=2004515 RepID=UPI003AF67CEF
MRDHELRKVAVSEMHLRRWPAVDVPSTILQWVVMVSDDDRAEELAAIESKSDPQDAGFAPSHRSGWAASGLRFVWERHSEGSSLTYFLKGDSAAPHPQLENDEALRIGLEWARSLPGEIVRSTRILLVANEAEAERIVASIEFERDELVSCYVGSGEMRVWSDFRIKQDGFGLLVVAANDTHASDLTRTLQQLQELGNYRNRALLGLPLARESWPHLNAAEASLRDLSNRVANSAEPDDHLLDALSSLSLELVSLSTAMQFRMDATKAYAQIVEERLEQLAPRAIEGFSSLDDFTQRRFHPAMNTCVASTERLRELAVRAEQLSSLLRARVETRIESQNADLLASMERSSSMQLRLQQLVEGLSVVALSYYALGLVKMALDGLPPGVLDGESNTIVGILVIPVLLGVWLATSLVKKRVLRSPPNK